MLFRSPATILKLFEGTDALRRPERFEQFLLACEADLKGRDGLEDAPYPQAVMLREALAAAAAVDPAPLRTQGLEGAALGERLRALRVEAIAAARAGSDLPRDPA